MAMTEKQQQHSNGGYSDEENVAYVANQVSSKCTQNSLRNNFKKAGEAGQRDTVENKNIEIMEKATEISNDGNDKQEKQLCSESFTALGGSELPAGGHEKEINEKKMEAVVMKEISVSLSHKLLENKIEEDVEVIGESVEQFGAVTDEDMKQLTGYKDKETVLDTGNNSASDETIAVMSLVDGKAQLKNETCVNKVKDIGERNTIAASSVPQERMDIVMDAVQILEGKKTMTDNRSEGGGKMNAEDLSVWAAGVEPNSLLLKESNTGEASRPSGAEVKDAVGLIVATLVDDVVDSMDAKPAKAPSSPVCMPHLSADEAMELLEAHQGDDNVLLPEHDEIVDTVMEVESKNHGYQWFDEDEEDDEEIALHETTDDVFGFDGVVDLPGGVTQILEDYANTNSAGSVDTRIVPVNSSRSPSFALSGSSSSSSASCCSSASSSEDESKGFGSKKRRLSGNNGPRKLLQYKKQKRVRSSELSNSPPRRLKRKRKIPKPAISSEFAVFNSEAADPILKGSYSVRKNRRACFQGNWGFTEEAFLDTESISPFEYTSHARVLQSRRKDDKRPISGKYGGFFKLRQPNGSLIKVREEQVDLQFLPMPSSDEEDEDEDEDMKGYESDEKDCDEVAASRYIVLGKGKNCFGRFLIRGYLSPESGRLTVKRRYLE
ncbi:unnamed protein product [Peronospora farinosa]|uniref:Uncharacterized protein n=1 Tax=Peronospora farinosa TaxID=134698 RepID=A0ABN8BWI3_9STRA|nr:unnamed protein product [Peronospora farinosa]